MLPSVVFCFSASKLRLLFTVILCDVRGNNSECYIQQPNSSGGACFHQVSLEHRPVYDNAGIYVALIIGKGGAFLMLK